MLSQKASSNDRSLNDILKAYLSEKPGSEFVFTPGISNRLDRNTSGLVLAGKNLSASRELNNAIKERRIDKYYLCIVKGKITGKKTIDGYLVKDGKTNEVRIDRTKKEDKAARILTTYEPLAGTKELTLLKVELVTGRSHQIRAHLSLIGHPILGDPKYGDLNENRKIREETGLKSQALHALMVIFREMNEPLSYLNGRSIIAPVPEDISEICKDKFKLADTFFENC